MSKNLRAILLVLVAILFISCPAAPPVDPINSSELYLTPSAVKSLTATNGKNNEIRLTWEPAANADSYQVWMIESKDYGTSSESMHGSSVNYAKLQERGFSFIGTVKDTRYDLTDLENNKAYVFAVIAMKNLGSSASIHDRVLYSDVTTFAEGSTIGDISISAISTSQRITVFWDVQNIFSVIPSKAGSSESLYDYKFSIKYKQSKQKDWNVIELEPNSNVFTKDLSYTELGLSLDTQYEIKVTMDALDGTEVINTIESITIPISTSVNFNIDPIVKIEATAGTKPNSVMLSWSSPAIPSGITLKNVFKIERAISDGTGTSGEWSVLLTPQEFDSLYPVAEASMDYSWEDTTVQENTKYIYRITNGYKYENGSFVMQDSSSKITESNVAWKTWLPTGFDATFTKESGVNPNSGTLKFSFDYPKVDSDSIKWTLVTNVWDENTGATTTTSEEITPVLNSESKYEVSKTVTTEDVNKLSVYTFDFKLSFESNDIFSTRITTSSDISLGTSTVTKLIDDSSIKASDDLVRKIKLEWTVDSSVSDDEYRIYRNNVEIEGLDQSQIIKDGLNRSITFDATALTEYRLSITAGGRTYNCPRSVAGNVLSAPNGLKADDGLSTDSLTVNWNPISSNPNIVYELEYTEKGSDSWKKKAVDASTGHISLDTTEITKKGQIYQFRMRAYNKSQDESSNHVYTSYSSVEEGSLFGVDAINLKATYGESPDSITLTWTPVPGAESYKIIRDGEELSGQVQGKDFTYVDKSILSIDANATSNPEPLSKEYSYSIRPIKTDLDSSAISAVATGKLFAPPSNIRATKGEYVGKIIVSWDAVENATSYTLQKGKLSGDEFIPVGDPITNIETNTYEDTISLESVYYSVKSVNKDGVESEYQNGITCSTNFYGEEERNNLGYKLTKPQTLSLKEQIDTDGYYRPYVKLDWSRVDGADGYIINVLNSSTQIDLASEITNKTGTIWTNGKSETEIGYLAYNTTTKMFTYNDATGAMKDSLQINGYSIVANNGTSRSEETQNNTGVRRGLLPADVALINMLNSAIYAPLHAVDDKLKHDWWKDNGWAGSDPSDDTTVAEYPGIVAHRQTYGINGYYPTDGSNYFKFTDYVSGNLTITSQNMRVNINNSSGGNLGTGYLAKIGCFDSSDSNTISVTINDPSLDGKYKSYSVKYKEISVRGTVDTSATYTVTVDGKSAVINDSTDIKRPF